MYISRDLYYYNDMKKLFPYFSQNPLDRLDQARREPTDVQNLFVHPYTKFILFFEGNLLIQDDNHLFDHKTITACKYEEDIVLLGKSEDISYFCIKMKEMPKGFNQVDLREFSQSSFADEYSLGILAQASSVLHWHNSHFFCGYCGGKTKMSHGGWRRNCLTCKRQHFPRIDPVVIMLVTHEDYCLLGKGRRSKQTRYSCLAGFMESGESIEDAARRELFEEAGVIGEEVKYLASQPWPFPTNLMIGVHVKAKDTKLVIDPVEIADAKWFHKKEVKALLDGKSDLDFEIPGKVAIARNLLEWWVYD